MVSTSHHDPNIFHFCNVLPSESASAFNTEKPTAMKPNDKVIELDTLSSTVAEEGEHLGEHPFQQLVAYRGNEEPEDLQIKHALLKSRMTELLKRKANANALEFQLNHYKSLMIGLVGPSPEFLCRDELITMALQADPSRELMKNMSNALQAEL